MLPILLRVVGDLAQGQAGEPLVSRNGAALAARADVAAVPQVQRNLLRRLLLPAGAISDAENSDVAARPAMPVDL